MRLLVVVAAGATLAAQPAPPKDPDALAAAVLTGNVKRTVGADQPVRWRQVRVWATPSADPASYSACGWLDFPESGQSTRFAARVRVSSARAHAEVYYAAAPPAWRSADPAAALVDRSTLELICDPSRHQGERLVSADWSARLGAPPR